MSILTCAGLLNFGSARHEPTLPPKVPHGAATLQAMTNKNISGLTAATIPLAGTEVLPIVQGGATVKTTVANIVGAGTSPGSFTPTTPTT